MEIEISSLLIGLFLGSIIVLVLGLAIIKSKWVKKHDLEILKEQNQQLNNTNSELTSELRFIKEEKNTLLNQTQLDVSKIENIQSENTLLKAEKASLEAQKLDLSHRFNETKANLIEKVREYDELKIKYARLFEVNKSIEEKLNNQKEEIEHLNEKLLKDFQNMAHNILESSQKKLTSQNKEGIDQLLKPLGENIKEFKEKVEQNYGNEAKERHSLMKQIQQLQDLNHKLSQDANNLVSALKGSGKTQGDWGEMLLESILEHSGLQKGLEYELQETLQEDGQNLLSQDGKKMVPDVLVKYPDGRVLIIDSKVSLTHFTLYSSAENDKEAESYFLQFMASLKRHIDQLSHKDYSKLGSSLDFTMMFVPIEPAYILAMQKDRNLWNYAYNKRIILTSPTNLIAALKIVKDLWKRDHQSKNAEEISKLGGSLYDKLASFLESMEAIDKSISNSRKAFDKAKSQLSEGKGNLISKVEKIKELGAEGKKVIPLTFKTTEE